MDDLQKYERNFQNIWANEKNKTPYTKKQLTDLGRPKDFSQNGEQVIFLKYFGEFVGTALEIGANDGETLSMSRGLFFAGWKLCLVEPSNAAFEKLLRLYEPDSEIGDADDVRAVTLSRTDTVTLVHAAITSIDGPIDLYDSGTHLKKGDVALLSTTVPKEMERWKKSGEQFTKTTVRGITFETLMRETGVTHYDFISIDCEGADWDVLKQIDLTAVGCRLLCVEVNNGADSHFTQYAAKHEMRLLHSNYENRIYARQ